VALEQGARQVETPFTLLIDADVASPRVVAALKTQMLRGGYHFVSVMASLSMSSFWKAAQPVLYLFFKMLYPFRLAKTTNPHFYSAAGGCIMLETRVFQAIGAGSIRGELIDDCALAARSSGSLRTGSANRGRAQYPYLPGLSDIWNMVARSAFTQLRYSPHHPADHFFHRHLFLIPLRAGPCQSPGAGIGLLAWAMMSPATCRPCILWPEPVGPLVAARRHLVHLYDWSSALRYWRASAAGEGEGV